jgi:hypothetical protein
MRVLHTRNQKAGTIEHTDDIVKLDGAPVATPPASLDSARGVLN